MPSLEAKLARLFHVDPEPLVRLGLQRLLENHPSIDVAGHVGDIQRANSRLSVLEPDLILTEIRFPEGGGLTFLSMLARLAPGATIAVLTDQEERVFAERCLRAGASGFLHKHWSEFQLLDAIEGLLRGDVVVSPELSSHMMRRGAMGDVGGGLSPVELLSNRELEVFTLLGEGMSTKEIASQMDVSPKTVESHRVRLKDKLDARDVTKLVAMAVSWRLSGELT